MKMKKILLRGGLGPFEYIRPEQYLAHNRLGTNVGNYIYLYSIIRTLMVPGCTCDVDYYHFDRVRLTQKEADKISSEYDCYIIPLADAFRDKFVEHLKILTENIRRMSIPVYVIGVGVRAPYGKNMRENFAFDEAAKEFVEAVLERSELFGVRGDLTREHLLYLGFPEDRIWSIGCPSMYTYGPELHLKQLQLSHDSKICLNDNRSAKETVHRFIRKIGDEYPESCFVPQVTNELREFYLGTNLMDEEAKTAYPHVSTDPLLLRGGTRFFLHPDDWIRFLSTKDLSIGTRLHGNVSAILGGTPAVFIGKDTRMRELLEYHHLTWIPQTKIKPNMTLEEVIGGLDLYSAERYQQQNFDRYLEFLHRNGFTTIYDQELTHIPYDDMLAQEPHAEPVVPYVLCSPEEQKRREEADRKIREKIKRKKKRAKKRAERENPPEKDAHKAPQTDSEGKDKPVPKKKSIFKRLLK